MAGTKALLSRHPFVKWGPVGGQTIVQKDGEEKKEEM